MRKLFWFAFHCVATIGTGGLWLVGLIIWKCMK